MIETSRVIADLGFTAERINKIHLKIGDISSEKSTFISLSW